MGALLSAEIMNEQPSNVGKAEEALLLIGRRLRPGCDSLHFV